MEGQRRDSKRKGRNRTVHADRFCVENGFWLVLTVRGEESTNGLFQGQSFVRVVFVPLVSAWLAPPPSAFTLIQVCITKHANSTLATLMASRDILIAR